MSKKFFSKVLLV